MSNMKMKIEELHRQLSKTISNVSLRHFYINLGTTLVVMKWINTMDFLKDLSLKIENYAKMPLKFFSNVSKNFSIHAMVSL